MTERPLATRTLGALLGLALLWGGPAFAQSAAQSRPSLETVKTFGDDFRLVGIGVSHEGRIFATAPAQNVRSRYSMVEIDPKSGKLKPYPDLAWNQFTEHPNGKSEWLSLQALWVDKADRLWALDSSLPTLDQKLLPPKLVEFDLSTDKVVHQYVFRSGITPKDSLNDVRVDVDHGYAYLTNSDNKGGLVVLDLKTGQARQVLVGDRSTFADPKQHLLIGNQVALKPNGKIVAIQADGIALSPDAQWLYYRPLTDHNYWRVPTAALRDATLAPQALATKVEYLGSSVLSGGLIMDRAGTLYGGDLEHRTVVAMTLGSDGRLKTRIFASGPQLSWADGFAISGGYLYIADSHLWEVAFKNDLPRSGPFTIFKVRLPEADQRAEAQ
jgi:sugar lactone lactonase YvrE